MNTKLLITIILNLFMVYLFAVPSYPYPVEITQPDGSKLTIIQKGDEFFSWIETTDGYSIVKNANGIFEYATLSSDGNIAPSGVKVNNTSARTTSETAFITLIPQSEIWAKRSSFKKKQDSQERRRMLMLLCLQ